MRTLPVFMAKLSKVGRVGGACPTSLLHLLLSRLCLPSYVSDTIPPNNDRDSPSNG